MRTIRPVLALLSLLDRSRGLRQRRRPCPAGPRGPPVGDGYAARRLAEPAPQPAPGSGTTRSRMPTRSAPVMTPGSSGPAPSSSKSATSRSALRTARDAIVAMGGYVGASNTSNSDDQPFAEITYRIPADRWEDALDVLRNLNGLTKKVVNEQTQAVEVTGQIVDLQARIKNLRASETALQTHRGERRQGQRRPRRGGSPDRRSRPDRAAHRAARGPQRSRGVHHADGLLQHAGRGGGARQQGMGSQRPPSTKRQQA